VEKKLQESGVDKSLPTIFLAECVLVYIDSSKSRELLKWIAQQFPTALFVNYEQVNKIKIMRVVSNSVGPRRN
jgi:[phosphatase 2A protein]-leucine-carboxy methyltransferase